MSGHEPNPSGPPAWQKVWRATEWWETLRHCLVNSFSYLLALWLVSSPDAALSWRKWSSSPRQISDFLHILNLVPNPLPQLQYTHTITASVMVHSCAGGHLLHTRSCLPLLQLFVVQVLIIAVMMRTGDKVRGDKGNLASNVQYIVTHPLKKHWDTWYYTGM